MDRILPANTEWKGVPYVGCAATLPSGSDCYPGTVCWVSDATVDYEYKDRETGKVIKVKLPKRIRIKGVDCKGVEGHSNAFTEDQRYVYFDDGDDDPNRGTEYSWRAKRKNYVAVGTPWRSSAAQAPGLGHRRYYRDPSF